MEQITTFIDGSEYNDSVCDHAVWAARQLSRPISLVHVIGRNGEADAAATDRSGNLRPGARSELMDKLAKLDAERVTLLRGRGREILDDATKRIETESNGAVKVSSKLRFGDLIDAITELEPETRFTILGKRGVAAGIAAEHLGSNLDRAVRGAKRPVLVANRAFKTPERFLFAFDGSASSERALERVISGSVLAGLSCDIVSVGQANPKVREKLEHAGAALERAGFVVTQHLEIGDPETVMTGMVSKLNSDILVLGKTGHSRLRQLFVGSTTMELMRTCRVPVLVFP